MAAELVDGAHISAPPTTFGAMAAKLAGTLATGVATRVRPGPSDQLAFGRSSHQEALPPR